MGFRKEIRRSKALKVYVANLMTQPGETRGYTAADHVRALHEHAGGRIFDYVILNTREISRSMRRRYAAEHAEPVVNDLDEVRALGVGPVLTDVLRKVGVVRHESKKLAQLLLNIPVMKGRQQG